MCALLLALGGCSGDPGPPGAVEIAVGALDETDARACTALVEDLPRTLADLDRRDVSPAGAPGAAWGDPALVLTCGAGSPAGLTRVSTCTVVEGVDWFAPPAQEEDMDSDVLLTTVGLEPRVSLLVPAERRGPSSATALVELAGPLKRHLRVGDRCG